MPPRLARLLAVVVAVVLVTGAFVLRGVLSDDDGGEVRAGAPGDEGDGSRDRGAPTEGLRVVCDEDLGGACDALAELAVVTQVTVLSAEEAAAALAEAPRDHDAWITLDPVPAVVAAVDATFDTHGDEGVVPVASSTLAVLAAPTPDLRCDVPITWGCLTSEERRPPVGAPDPRTALGSMVLGHAAVGIVGRSDFGIDVVRGDPEIEDQLQVLLLDAREPSRDQTIAFLQPGRFTAVITSEALARATAGTGQGRGRGLTVHALADAPTVGVVVAPWAGTGPESAEALAEAVLDDGSGQTVQQALAEAGWDGEPARSTGLPDPDVIYALQEELAR